MPFGKYRGWALTSIPGSYLVWVLDEADGADPWLKEAICHELARRANPPPVRQADGPDVEERLTTWYREMSRKFHPDRGGSNDAMKAINVGYERLKELLLHE